MSDQYPQIHSKGEMSFEEWDEWEELSRKERVVGFAKLDLVEIRRLARLALKFQRNVVKPPGRARIGSFAFDRRSSEEKIREIRERTELDDLEISRHSSHAQVEDDRKYLLWYIENNK